MTPTNPTPEEREQDYDWEFPDEAPCWTCNGTGFVNPLTCPKDFLCLGTTECPTCDGTGEQR